MSSKHDPTIPATANSAFLLNQAWDAPSFIPASMQERHFSAKHGFRLFHVTEIGEGKANAYRLAMANVIAGLDDPKFRAVYILSGTPEGISLYVGVASSEEGDAQLHEMAKTLKASFEGNFLGAKLENVKGNHAAVNEMLNSVRHLGLVTGVPSFNEDDGHGDEDFQGIERLANSMIGETWQLIVVAEPGNDTDVRDTLQRIYNFSTELSEHQKKSVQRSENMGWSDSKTSGTSTSDTHGTNKSDTRGKNEGASKGTGKNSGTSSGSSSSSSSRSEGTNSNEGKSWGTSESFTKGSSDSLTKGSNESITKGKSGGESLALTTERVDKHVEELQKHLSESLIPRFQQGRSKGMFRTAIYVAAPESATYDRLARGVLSIFQGNESTMTPLRVDKFTEAKPQFPLRLRQFIKKTAESRHDRELAHSIPFEPNTRNVWGGTWTTTRELALVAGLPTRELPGLKVRKSVDFALNTPSEHVPHAEALELGHIVQHGRLVNKQIRLPIADLNKHVFVTGVTGAGKTTTCMKLLLESGLPFMVIEPAKTEYRALHSQCDGVESYVLGREDITPFRLNPFELISPDENLAGHIDTLKATLSAVFPMEASMPYIVANAIICAYKAKGWDIHSGENFLVDDPWADGSHAWPIFSDMIQELDGVIKAAGMGREFEEKYRGSLVSRLTDLTLGTKGRMLNTRQSLDFDALLDKKVVIELEEIKDEQDKALFMGFILQRLAECMKHRHRKDSTFKHLTLVEEAHRLLSRPEPGESDSKKQGVETFANMLAEVRKYGEGLIIADQIPNKLVSDVVKNTHTKIVHRLFAADDRNTIGDAMGLTDDQKAFLPLLQPGETVMYCGGWHGAVRVQIDEIVNTAQDDITEDMLKVKGMALTWTQRHRLYPRTAEGNVLQTAEALTQFVTAGSRAINWMLRANFTVAEKSQEDVSVRLQSGYAKAFVALTQIFKIDGPMCARMLTDLFFDISGFMKSHRTDLLLAKVLPESFQALHSSMADFLVVRKSPEGKAILMDELIKLHKLESV